MKRMNRLAILLMIGAAWLSPHRASAQEQGQGQGQEQEHEHPGDDLHGPIVVTAPGLGRLDMLAGTSVLAGVDLQRSQAGQLGEVLAGLPGVSASGFAPGSSRPVLRGFSGERVRLLEDGIGLGDASAASADHAVAIDPLLTERIEVLRGPAVLLYGSQAIGGAVNVIGKRIPPKVPGEAVHVDALAALDTAYDRREIGASADLPLGESVAFHVDGSWRETGDLAIPGFAASDDLRASLFEQADEAEGAGDFEQAEALREGANTRDKLPNSWTETLSLGTGIGVFSGDSNLGFSFGYYDTSYGIPGLPGAGEANVSIGMKKHRVDLRGALDLGEGFFDSVQTRWGYSSYTHTEFEGDEVGTVFDVSGVEGRVELVQSRRGGWRGSIGGQYSHVDFETVGDEAFVPPNTTENAALFAVQEIALDPFQIELGGRFEHSDVALKSGALSRQFNTFSGALGLSYALADSFDLGVNVSRASRAPSAQELFALGPHVATRQYEIGNPALGRETAWGIEAWLRGMAGPAQVDLAVYRNRFDGFIYLAATGAGEAGLPVFVFRQQDAVHFGIEGEIGVPLYRAGGFTLRGDLRGDYVRATLADGAPVPRIPPLSLLAGLEAEAGHFDARAEVQWFSRQDRLAPLETPTDGFAQVNLSLVWHPLAGSENLTLMLQADNLFNAEGRRHASFTKDFVPLAGRAIRLSAKASF